MIHERVKEWTMISNWNIGYFRFSPPNLGDIKLDETNPTILKEGMTATSQYLANRQKEVDNLIEMLSRIIIS
jgi:hypothetical protein